MFAKTNVLRRRIYVEFAQHDRAKQNEANWNCASTDFGVWLERRAKLEKSIVELDTARIADKILAIQLKLSRYAEEDKHCTHLMLI